MERIHPPKLPALMLRNGQVSKHEAESEFGFYSCLLTRNKPRVNDEQESGMTADGEVTSVPSQPRETILNETLGSLMRTKASHHNEGGVHAGSAVIDTPFVVPTELFERQDQILPTVTI